MLLANISTIDKEPEQKVTCLALTHCMNRLSTARTQKKIPSRVTIKHRSGRVWPDQVSVLWRSSAKLTTCLEGTGLNDSMELTFILREEEREKEKEGRRKREREREAEANQIANGLQPTSDGLQPRAMASNIRAMASNLRERNNKGTHTENIRK